MKSQKTLTADERIQRVIISLLRTDPLYADYLLRWPRKIVPRGTIGVDGRSMIYNPEWVNQQADNHLRFILKHEVMHVILKHTLREKGYEAAEMMKSDRLTPSELRDMMNTAGDLEINSLLTSGSDARDMPEHGMLPGREGYEDHPARECMEGHFDILRAKHKPPPPPPEEPEAQDGQDEGDGEPESDPEGDEQQDTPPDADSGPQNNPRTPGDGEGDETPPPGDGQPTGDPSGKGQAPGDGEAEGLTGDGFGGCGEFMPDPEAATPQEAEQAAPTMTSSSSVRFSPRRVRQVSRLGEGEIRQDHSPGENPVAGSASTLGAEDGSRRGIILLPALPPHGAPDGHRTALPPDAEHQEMPIHRGYFRLDGYGGSQRGGSRDAENHADMEAGRVGDGAMRHAVGRRVGIQTRHGLPRVASVRPLALMERTGRNGYVACIRAGEKVSPGGYRLPDGRLSGLSRTSRVVRYSHPVADGQRADGSPLGPADRDGAGDINQRQREAHEFVACIGWRLFKAVARCKTPLISVTQSTKFIQSVKGRKRCPMKVAVGEVIMLAQWFERVRNWRRQRLPDPARAKPGEHGREILRAHIRRLLPHALIETRYSGEYRLQVFIGTPDAKGASSFGETYPGRHKWAKTNVTHRITVSPGWIRLPDSLKAVEGRLVLSAELVADGIYRVVTAVQSRGCALRVEHGWVATCATVDPSFGKTMCAADRKRSLRLQQFMGRAV